MEVLGRMSEMDVIILVRVSDNTMSRAEWGRLSVYRRP